MFLNDVLLIASACGEVVRFDLLKFLLPFMHMLLCLPSFSPPFPHLYHQKEFIKNPSMKVGRLLLLSRDLNGNTNVFYMDIKISKVLPKDNAIHLYI